MSFVLGDFGDLFSSTFVGGSDLEHTPTFVSICLWTLVPSPTLCPLAYMRIPYNYSNGVGAAKPLRLSDVTVKN